MSRKPICMPCLKEYRIAQIGRMVVYKTRSDDGTTHDHSAVMADVFQCPSCEHRIVNGFGLKPLTTNPSEVEQWAKMATGAIVVIL